ncbi:nuclear transport factor 2 family protein [Streptomyces sp. NPDC053367]|uniref:nuclear transport factor 2 family protein n=1 Tax=Streptomyces sp. NPDC053367 TaxID=3365700 RepID=UPI0037D4DA97
MAEHPHVQLVRKGYEAFQRGDMDALRELMTADCTQHVPGSHRLSGDYKGQDAIVGLYGRLFEETGGSLRVELRNVLVDGRGHAVAVHRTTARRGTKSVEMDGCLVFRIVGDKATDIDECLDDIEKADEFWT